LSKSCSAVPAAAGEGNVNSVMTVSKTLGMMLNEVVGKTPMDCNG